MTHNTKRKKSPSGADNRTKALRTKAFTKGAHIERKTKTLSREALNFPTEIILLKSKAGELGLWRTHHALDAATTAVGWELADMELTNRKRATRRKKR